jgi:hypothetical protein
MCRDPLDAFASGGHDDAPSHERRGVEASGTSGEATT